MWTLATRALNNSVAQIIPKKNVREYCCLFKCVAPLFVFTYLLPRALSHRHTNAIRESVYGILLSGCLKNTAGNLGLWFVFSFDGKLQFGLAITVRYLPNCWLLGSHLRSLPRCSTRIWRLVSWKTQTEVTCISRQRCCAKMKYTICYFFHSLCRLGC